MLKAAALDLIRTEKAKLLAEQERRRRLRENQLTKKNEETLGSNPGRVSDGSDSGEYSAGSSGSGSPKHSASSDSGSSRDSTTSNASQTLLEEAARKLQSVQEEIAQEEQQSVAPLLVSFNNDPRLQTAPDQRDPNKDIRTPLQPKEIRGQETFKLLVAKKQEIKQKLAELEGNNTQEAIVNRNALKVTLQRTKMALARFQSQVADIEQRQKEESLLATLPGVRTSGESYGSSYQRMMSVESVKKAAPTNSGSNHLAVPMQSIVSESRPMTVREAAKEQLRAGPRPTTRFSPALAAQKDSTQPTLAVATPKPLHSSRPPRRLPPIAEHTQRELRQAPTPGIR